MSAQPSRRCYIISQADDWTGDLGEFSVRTSYDAL
jgi:hypothetical protein